MAGSLKRRSPDVAEEIVLIQAMRDANLPKLLSEVRNAAARAEAIARAHLFPSNEFDVLTSEAPSTWQLDMTATKAGSAASIVLVLG